MEYWQKLWQTNWRRLAWQIRRRPGIRRNTIFIGFLVLALMITVATVEQIDRNHQLEILVANRANQIAFLEQQIANRGLENQFYQTDYYLELEARRQFGLVADNESLILLRRRQIDDQVEAWDRQSPIRRQTSQMSNWQLWWHFFWGREPSSRPESS